MRDITVPVPGGEINVWHRPGRDDSAPVVLVHGLSGTSRWWTRVIEHLPEDLGVLAIDVRGRGGSFDAPPPFDLVTMATDIGATLDHLGLDSAIVAGYSMGAWITALFAEANPERVERLLLIDGGFPIPSDTPADADAIIEAVVGPSLARLDIVFPDREAFYDYWAVHPALERHWEDVMRPALDFELAEVDGGLSVRINPEAVRESARQITVDPVTSSVGERVDVKTHLIVVERGTADQPGGMIPLKTAETAVSSMPNLTMQYLPAINHYTLVLGAGAPAVASAIAGV
jgi:pimeloyl-ACP methyl ester carboxylesterase